MEEPINRLYLGLGSNNTNQPSNRTIQRTEQPSNSTKQLFSSFSNSTTNRTKKAKALIKISKLKDEELFKAKELVQRLNQRMPSLNSSLPNKEFERNLWYELQINQLLKRIDRYELKQILQKLNRKNITRDDIANIKRISEVNKKDLFNQKNTIIRIYNKTTDNSNLRNQLLEHYGLICHKLEFMGQIKKWEDINSYFINLKNRINKELGKTNLTIQKRSNLEQILAKVNKLHGAYAIPFNKLIAVEARNILQNKEKNFISEMNELYKKFILLRNDRNSPVRITNSVLCKRR